MKKLTKKEHGCPGSRVLPVYPKLYAKGPGFYGTFELSNQYVTVTQVRIWKFVIFKFHNVSYDFETDSWSPLTLVGKDGLWYRPNNRFATDQGSVPGIGQLFVDKFRFIGFYLHDSGYGEAGLWVCNPRIEPLSWVFKAMTRKEIDDLLGFSMTVDRVPGSRTEKTLTSTFVAGFGHCRWNKHKDSRSPSHSFYLGDNLQGEK